MRVASERLRPAALVGGALVLAAALTLSGSGLAASQTSALVAMRATDVPWQEPWDGFWARVARVDLPLSAQTVTPPKGGTRHTLAVGAVHDGGNLYVLLEWPDPVPDDSVGRNESFSDAAAIQFPAEAGVGVPAICMGATGASVNIWQWRAAWQTQLETGSPASVSDTYPRTVVDSYPFADEEIFHPGRAVGNPLSDPNIASSVENLVAAGFGTLTADPSADVTGWAEWRSGTWRAVLTRPLAVGREGNIELAVPGATDVAFAVWDGAAQERDGIKSVSAFATLELVDSELPAAARSPAWWLLLLIVLLPIAVWLGLRAGRSG